MERILVTSQRDTKSQILKNHILNAVEDQFVNKFLLNTTPADNYIHNLTKGQHFYTCDNDYYNKRIQ